MQCSDVTTILESGGLSPLPDDARAHLAECGDCSSLVKDLSAIMAVAREFPTEVAPPPRIWVSLRNQLELEGLIREAGVVNAPTRERWMFGSLMGSRLMAAGAVGVLLLAAFTVQLRKPAIVILPEPPVNSFASTASALNEQEQDLSNVQLASTAPVDQSLRQNLQTVNEFIADCERRVKEEPQDELAREYLSSAYQQKAQLLSAMLERGRSLN